MLRKHALLASAMLMAAQPVFAQAAQSTAQESHESAMAEGMAAPAETTVTALPERVPAAAETSLPSLYQPQDDLERGLWLRVDEAERDLKSSALIIQDTALNDYVRGVLCKTVGEAECRNVRLYIMHTPHFNATMSPNGAMQVWSGLLLRTQNEAQLAAVLGHEYTHFANRHSVKLFREAKSKSNTAAWLAFTGIGLLASIGLAGSLFKFNREMEEEADYGGLDHMAGAGYDTSEAAVIWEQLNDELDATQVARGKKKKDRNKKAGLFATHPPSAERVAYLREKSAAVPGVAGATGKHEYEAAMAQWWPVFVDDQVKLNDFGASAFLLDSMAKTNGWTPWLNYARGELYRARGQEGDYEAAAGFYSDAIARGGELPELWRGRGLALRKLGRDAEARADLETYLAREPDAPDAAMITMISGGIE